MRRGVPATVLALLVVLGGFPVAVPAPVMGVNISHIKSVSADSPGQGLAAAASITAVQQQQVVQQETFEEKLERSENDQEVINERMQSLSGGSGDDTITGGSGSDRISAGDTSQSESPAAMRRQAVRQATAELRSKAIAETVRKGVEETDPETVESATEGTVMDDSVAATGDTVSVVSTDRTRIVQLSDEGKVNSVLKTEQAASDIEGTQNGKLVVTLVGTGAGDAGTYTASVGTGAGDAGTYTASVGTGAGDAGTYTTVGTGAGDAGTYTAATVDPETGDVTERATITSSKGSVTLEGRGDRIFISTGAGEQKAYHGSVSTAGGQFDGLDPEKYRGASPKEALATACDELSSQEWERAKKQFSGVLQQKYGLSEQTIEQAGKEKTCAALSGGGLSGGGLTLAG